MRELYITALLIVEAIKKYGHEITPAGGKKRFRESITYHKGKPVLWFNIPSGSTMMVIGDFVTDSLNANAGDNT
jgi:hypothetical protein